MRPAEDIEWILSDKSKIDSACLSKTLEFLSSDNTTDKNSLILLILASSDSLDKYTKSFLLSVISAALSESLTSKLNNAFATSRIFTESEFGEIVFNICLKESLYFSIILRFLPASAEFISCLYFDSITSFLYLPILSLAFNNAL